MIRVTLCTLLVAAGAASLAIAAIDAPPLPTKQEFRDHAEYFGDSLFQEPRREPVGGIDRTGLCFGGDKAVEYDFASPLRPAPSHMIDRGFLCPELGTFWLRRHDGRLLGAQTIHAWVGPFPMPGVAGEHGLAKRIKTEVAEHEDEFLILGSDDPAPGPNGELPPAFDDGGVLVALFVHPAGTADGHTDIAIIDPIAGLFWANRSGGFAGVNTWIGPFETPVVLDEPALQVRPSRIRARRRAHKRRITIRREVTGDENVRVHRSDYSPEDFHLGSGVEVLRVLRANRHKIRIRVRIAADATRGDRSVTVKGESASGLLTIR